MERLQMVIREMHHCDASHIETVKVHETFRGETVWQGEVEIFNVVHPKATLCYAWSHPDGKRDKDERAFAILGMPPVQSALDAVRVAIVAQRKARS